MTEAKLIIIADSDQAEKVIKQFSKGAIKGLGSVEKQTKETGESFSKLGKGIKGFLGPLTGLAAGFAGFQAIKSATKNLADFGDAVAEIGTIAGDAVEINDDFKNSLIDIAAEFGTDAASQANSFYSIISAGITDAAQAQETLIAANQLATGGLASTTESIDILTSALNVFKEQGLSATEASDTLFATVQSGKTTVSELASSFGDALPGAVALGFNFREASAALADLTTKGNNTSVATTKLKSLFASFVQVQGKLKGETEEIANAFDLQAIKQKGLEQSLRDIEAATGGDIVKLTQLLGSVEAVSAFITLAQGDFKNFADILGKDVTGASEEAANKIKESLGFQLKQLQSNFGNLVLKISSEGGGVLTETLKVLNQFLLDAVKNTEALTSALGVLATVAGTLFAAFKFKALIASWGLVSKAITLAKLGLVEFVFAGGGIKGLITTFKVLAGSINFAAIKAKILSLTIKGAFLATGIGALVVGIGLLVEKFIGLSDEVGGFGNAFIVVFNSIQATAGKVLKFIIESLQKIPVIGSRFKEQFESATQSIDRFIKDAEDSTAKIKLEAEFVGPPAPSQAELGDRVAKAAAEVAPKINTELDTKIKPQLDLAPLTKDVQEFRKALVQGGLSGQELEVFNIAQAAKDQFDKLEQLVKDGSIKQVEAAALRIQLEEQTTAKILATEQKFADQRRDLAKKQAEAAASLVSEVEEFTLSAEELRKLNLGKELAKNLAKVEAAVAAGLDPEVAKKAIKKLTEDFDKAIENAPPPKKPQGFLDKFTAFLNGGLVSGLSNLGGVFGGFSDETKKQFGQIAGIAKFGFNKIKEDVSSAVDTAVSAFNFLKDSIAGALSELANFIFSGDQLIQGFADFLNQPFTRDEDTGEITGLKITEAFQNLDVILGEFINEAPGIFTSFFEKLPSLLSGIFEQLPELFSQLSVIFQDLIKQLPEILGSFLKQLPEIIGSISEVINQLLDTLPQLIDQLFDNLPAISEALTDAVTDIFDKLPAIFEKIFERLPEAFEDIGKQIPKIINSLLPAIGKILGSLFRNLDEILVSIIDTIPVILESLVSGIGDLATELLLGIIDFVAEGGIEKIIEAILRAIPKIIIGTTRGSLLATRRLLQRIFSKEFFNNFAKNTTENLKRNFTKDGLFKGAINDAFKEVDTTEIKKVVQGLFDVSGEVTEAVGKAFETIFVEAFGNISDALTDIFTGIFESAIIQGVLGVFVRILDGLRPGVEFFFEKIVEKIAAILSVSLDKLLGDFFLGIINKIELIQEGFKTIPEWLDIFNRTVQKWQTSPEWIKQLEEIVRQLTGIDLVTGTAAGENVTGELTTVLTGGLNKVPEFASGGTVPAGFPNDTFVARLTSGETVTPANETPGGDELLAVANQLSRLEQKMGAQEKVIQLVLDSEVLASAILGLNQNNARLA